YNLEVERKVRLGAELGRWGLALRFGRTSTAPSLVSVGPMAVSAVPAERSRDWFASLAASAHDAARSDAFVVCTNVCKSYGEREVLRGIELTVRQGEVVVIMGPSGSGKSTLLRLVNHLEQIDGGEIRVDGKYVGYERAGAKLRPIRDLAAVRARARIGMVF